MKLNKKSDILVLAIVVYILISVFMFMFMIKPNMEEKTKSEVKLSEVNSNIQELKKIIADTPKYKEQVEENIKNITEADPYYVEELSGTQVHRLFNTLEKRVWNVAEERRMGGEEFEVFDELIVKQATVPNTISDINSDKSQNATETTTEPGSTTTGKNVELIVPTFTAHENLLDSDGLFGINGQFPTSVNDPEKNIEYLKNAQNIAFGGTEVTYVCVGFRNEILDLIGELNALDVRNTLGEKYFTSTRYWDEEAKAFREYNNVVLVDKSEMTWFEEDVDLPAGTALRFKAQFELRIVSLERY